MNKQILGAKKAAEEQSKPHKDRIAKLERELKDFVTEHRADMGKAKSKILTFGEVGFRLSTSVSLPRAKEKIEETMDNIICGFERQLDALYAAEAMDIQSDIDVMNNMMKRDSAMGASDFKVSAAGASKGPKLTLEMCIRDRSTSHFVLERDRTAVIL